MYEKVGLNLSCRISIKKLQNTEKMDQLKNTIQTILRLDEEVFAALEIIFSTKVLRKGAFLAEQGRIERSFAFIESGLLRAFYTDNGGYEYNKTFFLENEFVGAYSSLVTGKVNQINIQAMEDSVLLVANYSDLLALYDRFPKMEKMGRLLAEQYFVEKERREIELVLLNAEERYQMFRKEYTGLENRIPQYYIASYLGITPTQLSRIRAKRTA